MICGAPSVSQMADFVSDFDRLSFGTLRGDLASLHECRVVFGPIVDSIFRLVLGMDS